MTPVTQTITGEHGNCLSACFASLLDIPLSSVPNFAQLTDSDAEFFAYVDKWLARRGLRYVTMSIDGNATLAPLGYHTIEGTSPRGGQHAVVGFDGRMVFDPHPQDGTGRGLVEAKCWGWLEQL